MGNRLPSGPIGRAAWEFCARLQFLADARPKAGCRPISFPEGKPPGTWARRPYVYTTILRARFWAAPLRTVHRWAARRFRPARLFLSTTWAGRTSLVDQEYGDSRRTFCIPKEIDTSMRCTRGWFSTYYAPRACAETRHTCDKRRYGWSAPPVRRLQCGHPKTRPLGAGARYTRAAACGQPSVSGTSRTTPVRPNYGR